MAALFLAVLGAKSAAAEEEPAGDRWCSPELDTIGDSVCFVPAPKSEAAGTPKTLVIFLHSLVGATGSFRWDQQRLMARMAQTYGLTAIMPRGRPALGPGRDPNVIAWPTSTELQERYETELIAEWMAAKEEAERRLGKFDKVLVFGFSNGAYYATSLALRGKLDVDGYAVFAGGSGGKYSRLLAEHAPRKVPIFVGYGTKDPDHRHQQDLVSMLSDLDWKHRAKGDRIGHTVSDAQVRGALAFLLGTSDSEEKEPVTDAASSKTRAAKSQRRTLRHR